jgi:hypothetical protein
MTLTRQTIFTFAAALLMVVAVTHLGFAQTTAGQVGSLGAEAGSNLAGTLKGILEGNIGFFIGLLVVVLGLWTWVIKQETGAGITMIIGGVLITLAPNLFSGVQQFMSEVVDDFDTTQ